MKKLDELKVERACSCRTWPRFSKLASRSLFALSRVCRRLSRVVVRARVAGRDSRDQPPAGSSDASLSHRHRSSVQRDTYELTKQRESAY